MGESIVPYVLAWAVMLGGKLAWAEKVAWAVMLPWAVMNLSWAVMQNEIVLNLDALVPCKTWHYGLFSSI